MMNPQLTSVLLLGTAFQLIIFSFQTSIFIQQTVVNSIKSRPEYHFTGNGYISLCVVFLVFSGSNWLAPSIISMTGLKYGMFLGAIIYSLYTASFLYPNTILFYAAAALAGLGAGPLWAAQGTYLAKNSNSETSGPYASLFWSMLQSGILLGNTFVYVIFSSQTTVSDQTRCVVYAVLTLAGLLGATVLLLLSEKTPVDQTRDDNLSALGQLVSAFKLSKTANILILSFAFFFTGQLSSFFSGVFGTAIGATSQFGIDARKYIGLSGIFIGVGEIVGGLLFGLLGAKYSERLKRDSVFVLGYLIVMIALVLVFLDLPPDSSMVAKAKMQPLIEPRVWIAMLASFCFGFGDACFNTQIYSLLMSVYINNSLAAFAIFKFVQSLGSAIFFFYSTTLNLHHQLYLLVIVASIATSGFCYVEWKNQAQNSEKLQAQQAIVEESEAHRKKNKHIIAVIER